MKKLLPAAVLAASLTGVSGAQAVHLNPEGLGQVLLFPFYSAEGTNDTYINLVNTTDEYKAIKVRILESMNSKEVLDFNVYLSPWDHWSAVITADAGGDGATLTSNDNSCTVPLAVSNGDTIPFRTFEFTGDSVDGAERTNEGYVEVIEMGTVVGSDLQAAIKHDANGVPGDCSLMNTNWSRPSGVWLADQTVGLDELSGGLYGYGVLIDVPAGAAGAYDAVAIDNWVVPGTIPHTAPGSTSPSIGSDADTLYDVFTDGGVVSGAAFNGWDAVSAVLMTGTIGNDYVLEPSVLAGTDWVVTFPTKREYVNGPDSPDEPFTNAWDPETSTACETFEIRYWDREEGEPTTPIDPTDFSPLPPPGVIQTFSFCREANVLTFNNSDVLDASERTGVNLDFEPGFDNGWAKVDFFAADVADDRTLTTIDHTFFGLPAVGFAVQRYVNGDLPQASIPEGPQAVVRANYGGTIQHKGNVMVSAN